MVGIILAAKNRMTELERQIDELIGIFFYPKAILYPLQAVLLLHRLRLRCGSKQAIQHKSTPFSGVLYKRKYPIELLGFDWALYGGLTASKVEPYLCLILFTSCFSMYNFIKYIII